MRACSRSRRNAARCARIAAIAIASSAPRRSAHACSRIRHKTLVSCVRTARRFPVAPTAGTCNRRRKAAARLATRQVAWACTTAAAGRGRSDVSVRCAATKWRQPWRARVRRITSEMAMKRCARARVGGGRRMSGGEEGGLRVRKVEAGTEQRRGRSRVRGEWVGDHEEGKQANR
eukprot:2225579-Pleurochrysis_carterae.AAC.6